MLGGCWADSTLAEKGLVSISMSREAGVDAALESSVCGGGGSGGDRAKSRGDASNRARRAFLEMQSSVE